MDPYETLRGIVLDPGDFTYSKREIVYFHPMGGSKFHASMPVRLMLVGRATNGWIKGPNGEDISTFSGWDCERWMPYSAFWRVTRKVLSGLGGDQSSTWYESIYWTNLYRISFKDKGNPTDRMCRLQLDACKVALFQEIAEVAPTHILLLTGDWFNEFVKDNCNVELQTVSTKPPIWHSGWIHGYPFVNLGRPERKPERTLALEAVEAFKRLDEIKNDL